MEIDIPIEVMEVREVELLLESNIGTPRPDALLNLLFTIENRGNADMTLVPTLPTYRMVITDIASTD